MRAWLFGAGAEFFELLVSVGSRNCGLSPEESTEAAVATIQRLTHEAGRTPDPPRDFRRLMEGFKEELGIEMVLGELTEAEKKTLDRLVEERRTEEWIFSKHNDLLMKAKQEAVGTKVRGGLVVSESIHKAGKLIRILLVSNEESIENISISGDFFTQPYTGAVEKLEESLVGVELTKDALSVRIKEVYETIGLMVFGASQDDFVKAILKAKYETG